MIWNPGSKKLNGQKALYLRASRNCGSAKCFCQKFSITNKFYVQIGMAFRNVSSTSSKSSKLHRTPIIDVEYPLRILITHSLTHKFENGFELNQNHTVWRILGISVDYSHTDSLRNVLRSCVRTSCILREAQHSCLTCLPLECVILQEKFCG